MGRLSTMRYWKVVTGLLVLWLLIIFYMSSSVFPGTSDTNLQTQRQLQRAMDELQKLRNQNKELHSLANELKDIRLSAGVKNNQGEVESEDIKLLQERLEKATEELRRLSVKNNMSDGPTLQHEIARRRVQRTATEFWYYISSELNKLKKDTTESSIVKKINSILGDSADYQKTLKYNFHMLSNGVDEQEAWRLKESKKLGDLVQRRLQYLQNPKDCKKAKKMVCNLGKGCGYGCQLHHVTFCLLMSYANQRTLILESKGWRYAAGGWESVFLPLSKTCTDRFGTSSKSWGTPELIKDVQVIELPIVDSLHPRPDYLPLSVPADLADRISRFHGDPTVWWIGQFVKYLTRPQNHLAEDLDESVKRLQLNNPIVGVHVRRTDKVGLEAAFHAIEEYMQFVEEWFDAYEMRHSGVKRKVFLATDDPGVLNDAKSKYPHYTFISDNEVSKSAGLSSRYTDTSLRGVIHDIHMLSLCDYLVCTFSSQVCRVAYELMQPMHGDASQWFKSLDDIYYFGGQNGHHMVAVQSHQPRSKGQEIALAPGDMVGIAGNHWDGYSKGKNNRNGQAGLFPSYKVEERIVKVKQPIYPEVPDTG